jgi:hypothetical protein
MSLQHTAQIDAPTTPMHRLHHKNNKQFNSIQTKFSPSIRKLNPIFPLLLQALLPLLPLPHAYTTSSVAAPPAAHAIWAPFLAANVRKAFTVLPAATHLLLAPCVPRARTVNMVDSSQTLTDPRSACLVPVLILLDLMTVF